MARARGRSRGPGHRAGITAEAVVLAARDVYTSEGISGLTMRAVAERLGVAANALYSHVPSKMDLVDALIEALLVEIVDPPPDLDWREGLVRLMSTGRVVLRRYADLMPLFLSRPTRGPNARRLGETTLRLLSLGGIEGAPAVAALRVLLVYTIGFAAQEAPRLQEPDDAGRKAASRRAFGTSGNHPRLRSLATELAEHPGDAVFETGLRWIIQGIESAGRAGSRISASSATSRG